jgi:hypothetical protein
VAAFPICPVPAGFGNRNGRSCIAEVMRLLWTILVAAGMALAVPAYASDLEKQCQGMALKAHPSSLPDIPSVTNLRNDYYKLCMDRRGQMDPELTHGQ